MRVADRPLDSKAVAAANAAMSKDYCPAPQPGDHNYGAFRKEWMDSYVAAGGKAHKATKAQRKEQARKDRAAAKKHQGNRGAIATCPNSQSRPQPTPPPPVKQDDCPCKISGLNVTCGHGRAARNGLLMVVPSNALGDEVSVAPKASGDCATRLTVRADGHDGYPAAGAGASSFRANGPVAADAGLFGLRQAAPTTTLVSAGACGASVETIKVEAYPDKKVSTKVDLKELHEKYKGLLAYLPIDMGEPRLPIRPIDAPKDSNWDPKKMVGVVSAEAQWAEDGESNLAYCEMSLNGGLDPLLGVEAAFPIYGIPVPPKVAKYVKAGLYVNVSISCALTASCAWAYWPDKDATHWRALKLELKGSGSAELAAELLVLSPDALQAKASGKTEVSVKGWGEKESEHHPALKWGAEWKPLTVAVVFKLAWGLVEVERSWPIFEPIKTPDSDDYKYVFFQD